MEQSLAGKHKLFLAHAAPLSKPSDAVLAEKGWVGTEEKEELQGLQDAREFDWSSLFFFGLFTFR